MANDFPPKTPTSEQAREQLTTLEADSVSFAGRARFSPLICCGFGLLAVLYVSRPLLPADGIARDASTMVAVGLTALLLWAHVRRTGVRGRRLKLRQWLSFAAAVVCCLVLISISFALVSLDLRWWVAAVCVTAFMSVAALAVFAERSPL